MNNTCANDVFPLEVKRKLAAAEFFLKAMQEAYSGDSGQSLNNQVYYFEAYLFELVGSKDAFLMHLNSLLPNPLPTHRVSESALIKEFANAKNVILKRSIDNILILKADSKSWLSLLVKYRNIATHRQLVRRIYNAHVELVQTLENELPSYRFNGPMTMKAGDVIISHSNNPEITSERLLLFSDPEEYSTEEGDPGTSDLIDAYYYASTTLVEMKKLLKQALSQI